VALGQVSEPNRTPKILLTIVWQPDRSCNVLGLFFGVPPAILALLRPRVLEDVPRHLRIRRP